MGFKKKHGEGGNTNGEGRTKLYMVWSGMRARCRDPRHISYKNYGARGIKVSPEWDTYPPFRKWAYANGYVEGLEIDRVDADGHYSPDNCRWATKQANRRRNRPTYVAFGEAKTMMEWSEDERCACTYYTLRNRIQRGWDIEEALTTPTQAAGAKIHLPAQNWKGQPIPGRTPLKPRVRSLQ